MHEAKTGRLPAAIRRKSIWKATCMEIVHAWFGEGRMKKGRVIGTSSAAYSTALPQPVCDSVVRTCSCFVKMV